MSRKPIDFHGFVGQRKWVRFLTLQIKGCKALSERCPHLLVIGSTGMGKTSLANAVKEEYRAKLRIVKGKASAQDLCAELVVLEKADFLFLDEAHNLSREVQELLYQILECGNDSAAIKDHLRGEGDFRRDAHGRLVIPPVTIILATDQPGKLLNALRKRMEHTITLMDYSDIELREIATNVATKLNLLASPQAIRAVANASQGQPRRAEHILRGLRINNAASPRSGKQLSGNDVRKYLYSEGRDAQGLDDRQCKYIETLYRLGGPNLETGASLETLASFVGSDAEETRAYVEFGLVKLGYVRIERTGRRLTPAGKAWWIAHIAEKKARRARKQQKQKDEGEPGGQP